jgi:hypothetical protein
MVETRHAQHFGLEFIPENEYGLRNLQNPRPKGFWRPVTASEIETLVKNGNTCEDWKSLQVSEPFRPELIKNSRFVGLVRIGRLENVLLRYHDLELPAGIVNSLVISCDIGDNCSIHDCAFLAHYIVGNSVILFNLGEVQTTNHAKFGNGVVKDGEPEDVRIWIDLVNETGGRSVLPFAGMIPADAFLWISTKDDAELQERLLQLTQARIDSRRGYYGRIGDHCVIKHSRIIKDAWIGEHCYIKGVNKLKNVTIDSTMEEPSQIGEGVELVNGIIGVGCAVFYGSKAVRFLMGPHCKLKYGARLIHSFLGDNSTVSCCEMLNSLLFPAHEQHHNNSFLTASLLMGQSNLAAGVTAGSNHNSRANDGEIRAGRGFWPGLATTLKHSCYFASFCLLVKGDYPAELNVRLPFALLSNDVTNDRLLVMPAFWWMYNMYALARNTWKFLNRDHRKVKAQKIEFDAFAPDTVEEMFEGMSLLQRWTAQAYLGNRGEDPSQGKLEELAELGRRLLEEDKEAVDGLEVLGEDMENTRRKCVIQKPCKAYHAYRDMIRYYAVKQLMGWQKENPGAGVEEMAKALGGPRETSWVNMGGQLMTENERAKIIEGIKEGRLASWDAVHAEYDRLWAGYGLQKQRHAYACLLSLLGKRTLPPQDWKEQLDAAAVIQRFVCDQTYLTRKKDFENPFRRTPFRSQKEMDAVLGVSEKNPFIEETRKATEDFITAVEALKKRAR